MVWLDGGIHSREWVSSATMMYFVDVMLGEEEQGQQGRVCSAKFKTYNI
mgnify:CR=1 FL=1